MVIAMAWAFELLKAGGVRRGGQKPEWWNGGGSCEAAVVDKLRNGWQRCHPAAGFEPDFGRIISAAVSYRVRALPLVTGYRARS